VQQDLKVLQALLEQQVLPDLKELQEALAQLALQVDKVFRELQATRGQLCQLGLRE